MKRLFLTLFAFAAISSATYAQKVNSGALNSAIESAKEAVNHPKKGLKSSTWLSYGEKLTDAASASSSSIFVGMAKNELTLVAGNPDANASEVVTINGGEYEKFVYPTVDVYLQGEKVAFWNETKEVYHGALAEAEKAYKKAAEMDPKAAEKAKAGLTVVLNNYVATANNKYQLNDFEGAQANFSAAAALASEGLVGADDATTYKYYTAVAAVQGGDFASAAPIFAELAAANYLQDGDVYYYLGYAYEQDKKMAEAEKAYLDGASAFPANQKILNQLINFYIVSGEDPAKVIPFVKKAQAENPNDHIMVFVEGIAYQNMKDFDKAHDAYNKTKSMKPDFFDAYYNDALVFINQADAKVEELNSVDATNNKLYNETLDAAVDYLKQAVVALEEAHKVNAESRDVIELLKSTCFRLRDVDASYLDLYNKYNDMLKAM